MLANDLYSGLFPFIIQLEALVPLVVQELLFLQLLQHVRHRGRPGLQGRCQGIRSDDPRLLLEVEDGLQIVFFAG